MVEAGRLLAGLLGTKKRYLLVFEGEAGGVVSVSNASTSEQAAVVAMLAASFAEKEQTGEKLGVIVPLKPKGADNE